MKVKKVILLSGILCLTLLLCAFTIPQLVHLDNAQGEGVEISYDKAEVNENILTLYVNYNSYGKMFEIGQDIVVSTDKEFANPLRMLSRLPEGDQQVYTFAFNEKVNTIYIKPPVLYMPAEIEPVKVAASAGNSMLNDKGESWFSITSISIDKLEVKAYDGLYRVVIWIAPKVEDLPRFPKLVINGEAIGGTSSLNFNQKGVFDFGTFSFYIPAKSVDEVDAKMKDAYLLVGHELNKVAVNDTVDSSGIESLNIVMN